MVKLSSSLCSAGYSDTGMCTNPNWMAPFQSSRGMFVFSFSRSALRWVPEPTPIEA